MKNILLIVIHGSGGSPDTSNTVKSIKKYFLENAGMSSEIVTPTYSEKDTYDITRQYFDSLISDYPDYQTVAVIGNSLGGYWARYLANRIPGAKFIGLNPSFNFYGNDDEQDKPDMPITIYVAKDDDVVDPAYAINRYKDRGHVVVLERGGHRLTNVLPDILPCISKDIYTI